MFDFWLYEKNIIIETDGPQHSKYVKEFDGKDKTKYLKRMAKDTIKDEYCKVKKINLIRIPYEDFDNFEKRNLWPLLAYHISCWQAVGVNHFSF